MKGWKPDGEPVTLTAEQEHAVRCLLRWADGDGVYMDAMGRGSGKSVIIATAAKYEKAHATGRLLKDDPRRQALLEER